MTLLLFKTLARIKSLILNKIKQREKTIEFKYFQNCICECFRFSISNEMNEKSSVTEFDLPGPDQTSAEIVGQSNTASDNQLITDSDDQASAVRNGQASAVRSGQAGAVRSGQAGAVRSGQASAVRDNQLITDSDGQTSTDSDDQSSAGRGGQSSMIHPNEPSIIGIDFLSKKTKITRISLLIEKGIKGTIVSVNHAKHFAFIKRFNQRI